MIPLKELRADVGEYTPKEFKLLNAIDELEAVNAQFKTREEVAQYINEKYDGCFDYGVKIALAELIEFIFNGSPLP